MPAAAPEPPPEGHCVLEPRDVTVAEWSRVCVLDVPLVVLVAIATIAYLRWKTGDVTLLGVFHPAFVVVMCLLVPTFHSLRVRRLSPEARRQRFRLTDDALTVEAEDGSVRVLPWDSLVHLVTREGVAVVDRANGDLFPLPRRAWSPPAVSIAARAFVTQKTPALELPKVSIVVLLYVALTVLPQLVAR